MRQIAIINQKGGVGKTTTTANLGAALALTGKSVLLIDLDPQAHLSLHYGTELSDEQPSVYDVLTTSTPIDEVALEVCDNVTLVPSDIDLAGVETELVSVTGREVILREAVEQAERDHDVVLIDCPPSLGILTINALVAADELIIPLQAQFFALQGLGKLLDTVTLVRRRINPVLRVDGIVLCMHESMTRLAGEIVADLTSFLEAARGTGVPWADARLYKTCIRRNIRLAEASSFGKTIFDYAPRSNGAADYSSLADEVFADSELEIREARKSEVPIHDTAGPPEPTDPEPRRIPPRAPVVEPVESMGPESSAPAMPVDGVSPTAKEMDHPPVDAPASDIVIVSA